MQSKVDVFISYSRRDFDEVNKFVEMLKQRIPDLTYWFDLTGIEAGEKEFDEKIISAIKASSYILFFISDHSMDSKWTKKEVIYATNIEKKVIPVIFRETTLHDWFIFNCGRIDSIDLGDNKQTEKLLRDLASWTGKELKPIGISKEEHHKLMVRYNFIEEQIAEWCSKKEAHLKKMESLGVDVSGLAKKQEETVPLSLYNDLSRQLKIAVSELHVCKSNYNKYRKLYEELLNKTQIKPLQSNNNTINGHLSVDLGLSVKWATCNIGAYSPEGYGDYFSWGETAVKKEYIPDTCETYHVRMESISGNSNYDAARANWGHPWRMPTNKEIEELKHNCTTKWTAINGIEGLCLVSKINGNSIFLPAAGWLYGKSFQLKEKCCFYWSGHTIKSRIDSAFIYGDGKGGEYNNCWFERYYGLCIRAVSE